MLKFKYAFNGIISCFKDKSILTQIIISITVIFLCMLLRISDDSWVKIFLCIGLVVSLEIMNTCIERLCDLISNDYNEKIKYIKDLSAAGVLIASIVAFVVGLLVLLPYVMEVL